MPVMTAQRGAGSVDQQQRRRPEKGVPVRPAPARAPDQHADHRRRQRDGDAGARYAPRTYCPPAPGAAEQRRGRHDERRRADHQRELPAQPEPDRHAVGRRRDASPETADEIGRRPGGARRRARGRTIGAAGAGARARRPPIVSRVPARASTPARARERTQHGTEERGRGKERLETERRTDGRAHRRATRAPTSSARRSSGRVGDASGRGRAPRAPAR